MKFTVIGDRDDLIIGVHWVEGDSVEQVIKAVLSGSDGDTDEDEEPLSRIFGVFPGHVVDNSGGCVEHGGPITWDDFKHEGTLNGGGL